MEEKENKKVPGWIPIVLDYVSKRNEREKEKLRKNKK